jgi:hypothetical protein
MDIRKDQAGSAPDNDENGEDRIGLCDRTADHEAAEQPEHYVMACQHG